MSDTSQVPGPYEDTTCQMVVAYGKPNHRHLEKIREFRDTVLSGSKYGKLVDLYYRTAPSASKFTAKSRLARNLVLYTFAFPSYLLSKTALKLLDH